MVQEQMTALECIRKILRRYYDLYFKAIYEEHDEEKGKVIWEDIKCFNTIEKELLRLEPIKMLEKIKKYYENKELTQGSILIDEEREYLKNFLRPFRNEVEFITKNKVVHADDDSETNFQYLYIMLDHEYIQLPMFKKDTMYKGMALGYDYTLEELSIKYE